MTLSHWWQILTLYEVILVWPLALVTLLWLLRTKSHRRRLLGGAVLVLLFMPFIHRWAGDLYFDYLCEHEAGEFIYRTVDNVEGILQMRPRDGSKDYFDRMAKGDIPEDPWGHTNLEAQEPWLLFRKYRYFEKIPEGVLSPPVSERRRWHASMYEVLAPSTKFVRYYGYDGANRTTLNREGRSSHKSEFGYSWRSTRDVVDRLFNIYPGEITVVELSRGLVLAQKRGFYRSRPVSRCRGPKDETFVFDFVGKILKPMK